VQTILRSTMTVELGRCREDHEHDLGVDARNDTVRLRSQEAEKLMLAWTGAPL
jgi:hypothetical protein